MRAGPIQIGVVELSPDEARMALRLLPAETPLGEMDREDGRHGRARARLQGLRGKLLRIAESGS